MPDDTEDDDTPSGETVPKATHLKRLAAKQTKVDELTARVAELQAQIDSAPDASKLERRLQRAEESEARIRAEFDEYKAETESRSAILAAGVTDPDDIELVRWRYDKLGDDRPSLDDWLKGPAREDRHLRTLLEPEGKPEGKPADEGAGKGKGKPAPDTNAGTKPTGAPGGTWTLEHIMNMPVSERLKPENRAMIDEVLRSNR